MDNVQSGESKLVKACGYTLMPVVLSHVVVASNRPAAALESLRNTIAKNQDQLNNFGSPQPDPNQPALPLNSEAN